MVCVLSYYELGMMPKESNVFLYVASLACLRWALGEKYCDVCWLGRECVCGLSMYWVSDGYKDKECCVYV